MQDFIFYFKTGWSHIISPDATDHLYFIAALAVIYTFSEWKRVLILVTAFTIGHAITLYLSTLDIIRFDVELVEFAIPCTIVLTAASNMVNRNHAKWRGRLQYGLALSFGLIHGMGYANFIRMMLSSEQNLLGSLFSFNLGLECGQIFVVLFILMVNGVLLKMAWLSLRQWVVACSLAILVLSLLLTIERFPFLS